MGKEDQISKEVSYILNTAFTLLTECEKAILSGVHPNDERMTRLVQRIVEYRTKVNALCRKYA